MFPIGDDDSALRTTPVVTYGLIAINVLVFLLELNAGDQFIQDWSFIPSRFNDDPAGNLPTLLTAMFMHGGWMHLIGNMLYLYIFGDNIEDRFGHVRFLAFYLAVLFGFVFEQVFAIVVSSL
jgi:membrane associated rhomboid family serine protease